MLQRYPAVFESNNICGFVDFIFCENMVLWVVNFRLFLDESFERQIFSIA
jgi:hypothetical protein